MNDENINKKGKSNFCCYNINYFKNKIYKLNKKHVIKLVAIARELRVGIIKFK